MTAVVVFIAPIIAGFIQAVTGFGSGIFMMVFFPALFPILGASALSSSISLPATCVQAWNYRKISAWKLTLLPSAVYIFMSSVSILLAPYLPTAILKKTFGVVMILLSIYFLTISGKMKIKANMVSATICAMISGFMGGLFGIGGPPMVIYFLAALDSKEQYLGTLQSFFFITGAYTFIFRIINGIYTVDLIPYSILGVVGILIGTKVGRKVVDKINAETMKKLVYLFLGFAGLTNVL